MFYQGTETCCFCFKVRNEVKEPEKKFLIKSWKVVVLVFEAINKAR